MDGLEAVELNLSDALDDNDTNRIDSEYFKKEYLFIDKLINTHPTEKLGNLCTWVTQGPNPTFSEEGIPCLTGRNIKTGQVDYYDSDIVDQKEYEKLKRFTIKLNDILITLKGKGSIGKIGLVIDPKKSIFSRDVGLIRINKTLISPLYVFVFLMTKFGTKIIAKGETGGTGQSTLTTSFLKQIDIPIFSSAFQKKIEAMIDEAHQKYENSNKKYVEAQKLLESEFGLTDFTPSNESIAVKSFSDSFGISGRLDSEYYQPKYEEIKAKIENYPNGYKPLSEVCRLHDTNFTPNDNEIYKYIELSNIGGNGEIKDCMNEYGSELPTRARRKVKNGQVIVSSIEGSLPSIAIVNSEYDGALCSTGFYIITSEQINSETLLVLLKNNMMQLLLKKGCSGTILTAIGKDEFQSIPLPLIDANVQKAIAEKIAESFALRSESKRLLEEAKAAVEKAISMGNHLYR